MFDDVALSMGLTTELCRYQIQAQAVVLTRYEPTAREPGQKIHQVPDLVQLALGPELGYFNPATIKAEEIDSLQLEDNKLIIKSRGVSFLELPGVRDFVIRLRSPEEAAQAGRATAEMLKADAK